MTMPLSKIVALAAALAAFAVAGCDKEEDTDTKNAQNLIGTWKGKCVLETDSKLRIVQEDEEDGETYTIEEAIFTETTLDLAVKSFSDAACTAPTMTFEVKGTYVTGDKAASASANAEATALDLTITSISMTVHTAERATQFSQASDGDGTTGICGKTWTKDVATDISGCETTGGMAVGSVIYEIFKATETEVYFSDEPSTSANDGSTAAKRPTVLSTNARTKG